MAMCIQADRTPFTAGANDNASAVGLVLTLAETLRNTPLRHTRVWLACTGCEEVQHYGAIDFFRRHRDALKQPTAIAFEMLGCAGPSWLTREGIIVPFRADPGLVNLAEEIAAQHPELDAYPARLARQHRDGRPAPRHPRHHPQRPAPATAACPTGIRSGIRSI